MGVAYWTGFDGRDIRIHCGGHLEHSCIYASECFMLFPPELGNWDCE
jgi:hypothetical protein